MWRGMLKLSTCTPPQSVAANDTSEAQHFIGAAAAQQPEPNPLQSHAEGVRMENVKGLVSFVSELRATRTNLVNELRHVDAALSVLAKLGGGSSHRTLSAAGRQRISLAERARWAKAKGRAPKAKRTISAAGRKRIAAAQRARWARVKAGKKAG
jgi:hypothetical protein